MIAVLHTIRDNAADSAFEARVDIRGPQTLHGYACAVPGPVTMGAEDAAAALIARARDLHGRSGGLRLVA